MSSLHGRVPGLSAPGFGGRVKNLLDLCKDKNDSGLIDKEEFIKALQNPEELLAKPEEKKEPASSSMMSHCFHCIIL